MNHSLTSSSCDGAASLATAGPRAAGCVRQVAMALVAACLALLFGGSARGTQPAPQTQPESVATSAFAHLPVRFEQLTDDAGQPLFVARGLNYQFLLRPTGADILVRKTSKQPASSLGRGQTLSATAATTQATRLRFLGANPHAELLGQDAIPGRINYLIGANPAHWRLAVAGFAKVMAPEIYPGISVVYYANQQRLEYDMVLEPGADPGQIAFQFDGTDQLSLGNNGELVLRLGTEQIVQPPPILYQPGPGPRKLVHGTYRLVGPSTVGFSLGPYDSTKPLVIDPILSYSTLFGGDAGDLALSVKVDNEGFVFIAGETLSAQFSVPLSGFQTNFGGGKINGDAFVAKLNPTANALVYFTYLGGLGNEGALDLAVDAQGRAFLCGFTDSPNFPVTNALYPKIAGKPNPKGIYLQDIFVAELDASGSRLLYSTFLGGTNVDRANAIALDGSGNVCLGGITSSQDFPLLRTLPGQSVLHGPYDGFVAKLSAGGSTLLYSSYLGGTNADEVQGIAADLNGFAHVTGFTTSTNFPVTSGAFSTNLNGDPARTPLFDAFVAKINPLGGDFVYSTFLGGSNTDSGFRIALDSVGNAFVTGATTSPEFPNTATNLGLSVGFTNSGYAYEDVFVARFDPQGALAWSTRFGGSAVEVGWDIALDAGGNPYVVGATSSYDFPLTNNAGLTIPVKSLLYNTVFVTALDRDASVVNYSLPLGGWGDDGGYGIAVDPAGNAYVVGKTTSAGFPSTNAFQVDLKGASDTFLAKISREPVLATTVHEDYIHLKWRAFSPDYRLESSASSSAPPSAWAPVPGSPTIVDGWHSQKLGLTNQGAFFRLRRY